MNIVLFGAGAIAREHTQAIRRIVPTPGISTPQVMGVFAPRIGSAAAFAADLGIPASSEDPRTYLTDPAVDAVIVCSPSAAHTPQVRGALLADKHVLCEIPLALSVADALELRDLATQRQRLLMIGHTLRYHPALRAARAEIAEGRFHPVSIVARYLFLRRSNVGWTGYQRSWTDNLLWHHGGHAVDTCLWLLGDESESVVGEAAPPLPDQDAPLDLGIVVRTTNGGVVTIAMSYSSDVAIHDYTIAGRETTLRATPDAVTRPDGRLLPPIGDESPILTQDRAFIEAIQQGAPSPIGVDDILPSLRVLQAVSDTSGIWPTREEQRHAELARISLDASSNP